MHTLARSKVIFLCRADSLEHSPIQNQVIQQHFMLILCNDAASLCHNCLNSTAPDYLTEFLRIYKPTRQLRSSSDTSILCIPTVRTHSLGQRPFSYVAQTVWNTLPYEIRSSNTISFFSSSLRGQSLQEYLHTLSSSHLNHFG